MLKSLRTAIAVGGAAVIVTVPLFVAGQTSSELESSTGPRNETTVSAGGTSDRQQSKERSSRSKERKALEDTGEEVEKSTKQEPQTKPKSAGPPTFDASQIAESSKLNIDHAGQETDYWCGPASAYMIVDQMQADGAIDDTDAEGGSELSQSNLADDEYLDAESGGTYRDDMKAGLNKWVGDKKRYTVLNNPSPKEFTRALVEDVNKYQQAMAVATIEPAGGQHYNGHPSGATVDHWVVAYGYKKGGKVTKIADPGTTISSWSASPTFNHNTREFVENWVEPEKAIVW